MREEKGEETRERKEARTGREGGHGGEGGKGVREGREGKGGRGGGKSDRKVENREKEVERVSTCRMPRRPSSGWELCQWRLDVDQMLRRLHWWQRRAACEHNKVIRK